MATATRLSIDEYLATSYHPDCDFIDDHTEERTLGESPHSNLQVVLSAFVHTHRKLWRVRAYTEQRVRVAPNRVRIPDVCILPIGRPPLVLTEAPLACAEILSDCDTLRSTAPRMQDYHALGVQNLYILNPITLEAWAWTPEATTPLTASLEIPGTLIHIPLPELFAELNDTD